MRIEYSNTPSLEGIGIGGDRQKINWWSFLSGSNRRLNTSSQKETKKKIVKEGVVKVYFSSCVLYRKL